MHECPHCPIQTLKCLQYRFPRMVQGGGFKLFMYDGWAPHPLAASRRRCTRTAAAGPRPDPTCSAYIYIYTTIYINYNIYIYIYICIYMDGPLTRLPHLGDGVPALPQLARVQTRLAQLPQPKAQTLHTHAHTQRNKTQAHTQKRGRGSGGE
jgi:hypothetical protein